MNLHQLLFQSSLFVVWMLQIGLHNDNIQTCSAYSILERHHGHSYQKIQSFLRTSTAGDNEVENKKKLSIAIIGSGAVGCYYGARLWETDQYQVKFFMRGEHYHVSKQKGLNVTVSWKIQQNIIFIIILFFNFLSRLLILNFSSFFTHDIIIEIVYF